MNKTNRLSTLIILGILMQGCLHEIPRESGKKNLSDTASTQLTVNLETARSTFESNPNDEDAIIWYGRRLGYLSRFQEAIDVYSQGLTSHPSSYRLLRHRGHRYIGTRRFDLAIKDLESATAFAADKILTTELDGAQTSATIPSARPTETSAITSGSLVTLSET